MTFPLRWQGGAGTFCLDCDAPHEEPHAEGCGYFRRIFEALERTGFVRHEHGEQAKKVAAEVASHIDKHASTTNIRIASESRPLEVWDLFVRTSRHDPSLIELDDGDRTHLLTRADAVRLASILVELAKGENR